MSTTAPISLEWLNAKENKFSAYNISAETLALINKSETLKADIRAYAANTHVNPGEVSSKAGAGEYRTYVAATGSTLEIKGFLNIAADRFSTAESTFNILAHELGHFRVEEPGAAVANARANALAGNDKAAYESACNLTEGYAHYNEVMESHFGANGRAEYSTTFNDDGSRLVIDHDFNGHLGEHAIITYSAAGRAHLVGWTRDGYDGLIFTPAGGVIGADGNASGPPSSFGQFPAALPYLPAIYSDSDGDGPSWTIETPWGVYHGT